MGAASSDPYAPGLSGVYKSVNGGENWVQVLSTSYGFNVYSLSIHPQNSSLLFAGTSVQGVFVTSNSGLTWKNITSGLIYPLDVYDFGFNGNTIYCVTSRLGLCKSTNNGLDWMPTGLIAVANDLSSLY